MPDAGQERLSACPRCCSESRRMGLNGAAARIILMEAALSRSSPQRQPPWRPARLEAELPSGHNKKHYDVAILASRARPPMQRVCPPEYCAGCLSV